MTYHFDGFKSPAITEKDGERKYPFLINKTQIDKDVEEAGSEDSPAIWTMCRGFISPQGTRNTVLSMSFIEKFHMRGEKVKWQYDYQYAGGLDPAFTSGGDKCVLQLVRTGFFTNGTLGIEFMDPVYIAIEASSELPPIYQVARKVIELCNSVGMPLANLAVDESGTQSAGDVISRESGSSVCRVSFGSKASESTVSEKSAKKCCDEYADKATELWYAMNAFGRFDQIRNLPEQAAQEFCEREVILKGDKKKLMSKVDYKKLYRHSPDDADACGCALEAVRKVLGIHPGATKAVPQGATAHGFTEASARKWDLAGSKDRYLFDPFGNKMEV
jgi:hypothetical protein